MIKAILLAVLLTGCATGYQSRGFTGGFTDSQLAPEVFRVSFRGNGYTSEDAVADMVLLRSSDLALDHNFRYFMVVDSKEAADEVLIHSRSVVVSKSRVTSIGFTAPVRKPRATNVIVCFAEKPEINGLLYDAAFLQQSLGPKYKK